MKKSIIIGSIVAVILIAAASLLFSGKANEIRYAGVDSISCEFTPYDKNCTCEDRKVYVPWNRIPKWGCEVVEELMLDPESETFEQDAMDFAMGYLDQYCGHFCRPLFCGEQYSCWSDEYPNPPNPFCIEAVWGYGKEGERVASIECKKVHEWEEYGVCVTDDEKHKCKISWGNCWEGVCWRQRAGTLPWQMHFYVESEGIPRALDIFALYDNYCVDVAKTGRCASPDFCTTERAAQWAEKGKVCIGDLPIELVPREIEIVDEQISGGAIGPIVIRDYTTSIPTFEVEYPE